MFKKIIWISVFFILSSLNFAWEYPSPILDLPGFSGSPQVTPEQAKDIVRQWEGDPNLQLPEPELDWVEGDPLSYPEYEFNGSRYYIVDAIKGFVSMVVFSDAEFPSSPQWTLSPQQAQQIAVEFCSQKYPNFAQINWQSEVSQENNWGCYHVEFNERMPNGAWGPNACGVDIHPDTGKILCYTASMGSPPPTWEPSISQEQALQIAINATGFAEVLEVEGIELVGNEGILIWAIGGIEGIFPDGSQAKVWLAVDALSGNLRYREYSKNSSEEKMPLRGHIMINGKLIKRSEGPIFVGNKAFVSETLFKALGGDTKKLGTKKKEVIERGGRRFISTEMLKHALPNIVWDVIPYKDREALYIILYGDIYGLYLLDLPLEKRIKIREQWFQPSRRALPKGHVLTEKELDKLVAEDVENQGKLEKMRESIINKLEKAQLLATNREIRREFPKTFVDWHKVTEKLKRQKPVFSSLKMFRNRDR